MLRSLMSCLLVLLSLGACATLPQANPRTEAKLREANAALYALSADINTFYESLEPLLLDIKTLSEHSGWSDMEVLITAGEATSVGEQAIPPDREQINELSEWTAKWGDSGEELFARYQALADRCSISEARRIGLIGRLVSMQAWYLEITFLELSANRESQAEAVYSTVEALSKTQEELDSYTPDAIGLYQVASRP
jgi:hypothetical protein